MGFGVWSIIARWMLARRVLVSYLIPGILSIDSLLVVNQNDHPPGRQLGGQAHLDAVGFRPWYDQVFDRHRPDLPGNFFNQ